MIGPLLGEMQRDGDKVDVHYGEHDRISISKTENSKLEGLMSTDSLIQLPSMAAPTGYAYEEMAASGQFVTSAK